MNIDLLPDTFTNADARIANISPYYLSKLVQEGCIERVRRGVYRKTNAEDIGTFSAYAVASKKLKGQSAVCLLSALEYHHLTEVFPNKVWLLVDAATRSTKEGIVLFRRRHPMWNIGVDRDDGFLVTSIERSIAEVLAFKNKVGPNEAFYALRMAISTRRTTVAKVISVAKSLNLHHRVESALEAFIYG